MGRRQWVIRLVDGLGGKYAERLTPTHEGHVILVYAMLELFSVEAEPKLDT